VYVRYAELMMLSRRPSTGPGIHAPACGLPSAHDKARRELEALRRERRRARVEAAVSSAAARIGVASGRREYHRER